MRGSLFEPVDRVALGVGVGVPAPRSGMLALGSRAAWREPMAGRGWRLARLTDRAAMARRWRGCRAPRDAAASWSAVGGWRSPGRQRSLRLSWSAAAVLWRLGQQRRRPGRAAGGAWRPWATGGPIPSDACRRGGRAGRPPQSCQAVASSVGVALGMTASCCSRGC